MTAPTPDAALTEEQVAEIERHLSNANGLGIDEVVARHYRTDVPALLADRARLTERLAEVEAERRDLVSRLGFGDNVTEPMADNDTIVNWYEQVTRDASEWHESQSWRDECQRVAGHPDDEDCWEHDPTLRLQAAEARETAWREAVEGLADRWAEVLRECREADPKWLLDRSVMTLDSAHRELRSTVNLLAEHATPSDPPQGEGGHAHQWVRRQNVTSKGYVMPAYEVCECGTARADHGASATGAGE